MGRISTFSSAEEKKADKRSMESEKKKRINLCAYVPDIFYKKMCIESTLRSENVIKVEFFLPTKGITLQSNLD